MIESELAAFAGQRGAFAGRSSLFAGPGGTSPLALIVPQPSFSVPLVDAGAGAVNTSLIVGSGSATFTRATAAWAKLSTGLWAQVAIGVARAQYLGADTTVGAYGGFFCEEARTNLCLQSRDLSNASWTKLNITAAKDQAGIDGVSNSASSLVATAGGGSCLQTITEAATLSALSLFIKRIAGAGTVTIQQGATTADVTALINSSTYTRVELDAAVLNPAIGIVLGTNGDKIAVDMVQFENGRFATSPMPTTTVSVARNDDRLVYLSAGNVLASIGTASAEITSPWSTGSAGSPVVVSCNNGAVGSPNLIQCGDAAGHIGLFDGASLVASTTLLGLPISAVKKVATVWNGTASRGFVAGVGSAMGASAGLSAPIGITIGDQSGGTSGVCLNGTIRNVRIWSQALSDIQVASL